MTIITAQLLRDIAGTKNARLTEQLGPAFDMILPAFGINTPLRMAHWLGQACVETAYWKTLEEYSRGEGAAYGHFYGRGPMQLTWEDNYGEMGDALAMDLVGHPDLVATPVLGTIVGCMFWTRRNLLPLADRNLAAKVSRGINRGDSNIDKKANAEQERIDATDRALGLLGGEAPAANAPDLMTTAGVQAALQALGYYSGKVDGIAGRQTKEAVMAFQKAAGLAVDGIAGDRTRAALKARLIGG